MASSRERAKGSYEIRVCLGYDINGKKICKSKTWRADPNMTEKQLKKALAKAEFEFEEEVKNGQFLKGEVKFADFSKKWLTDYAEPNLSPKTTERYRELLKRINSAIGHIRLNNLKPNDLIRFYHSLSESGKSLRKKKDKNGNVIGNQDLAPKTILHYHRLISSMLNKAVKWQIIHENVSQRVDPPKVPYKEAKFLDDEQARQLILLLENEPIQYKTMIILLIYTGLRRGELCGLEWKDINFDKKQLRVARASQCVPHKGIITKEPKTRSSLRVIDLSDTAIILLKNYQKWQTKEKFMLGDKWVDTDRLFCQWNGKPIHPDTITGWFRDFVKRNNLPKVTIHSLRHTNATLLISSGTDIRTIAGRLGHAQTSTTVNTYSHVIQSANRVAADRLDALLTLPEEQGSKVV